MPSPTDLVWKYMKEVEMSVGTQKEREYECIFCMCRCGPQKTKKIMHLQNCEAAPLKIRKKLNKVKVITSKSEQENDSGECEICRPTSSSGLTVVPDTMKHDEQLSSTPQGSEKWIQEEGEEEEVFTMESVDDLVEEVVNMEPVDDLVEEVFTMESVDDLVEEVVNMESVDEVEDETVNTESASKPVEEQKNLESEREFWRKLGKFLEPIVLRYQKKIRSMEITPMLNDNVPFLVDGDSLLLMANSDMNYNNEYGGQMLHLVFICESLLHKFNIKNGNFIIVFRNVYNLIFKKNPGLYLTKLALIRHFKYNTKYLVLETDSFDENTLNKLFYDKKPSFLLTNLSSDLYPFEDKQSKLIFYYEFVNILKCEIVKVDLLDLEFKISTVYGFCIESGLKVNLPTVKMPYDTVGTKPVINDFSKCNLRLKIILNSAILYLNNKKMSEEAQNWVRLVTFYTALLDIVPLSMRSSERTDDKSGDDDFREFINEFLTIMVDVTREINVENGEQTIPDLWQGNFFIKTCLIVAKFNDKPTLLTNNTYECYINLLNSCLTINIELYPVITNCFLQLESVMREKDNICIKKKIKNKKKKNKKKNNVVLIPNNNKILNLFCEDILNFVTPKVTNNVKILEKVVKGADHNEIYHWHCKRLLSEEFERVKYEEVPTDPYLLKRYLRNKQMYARFESFYGASIEGRSTNSKSIVLERDSDKKQTNKKLSSKASKIVEENRRKKLKESENKDREKFENFKKTFRSHDKYQKLEKSLTEIDLLIRNLSCDTLTLDILMLKCEILFELWTTNCSTSPRDYKISDQLFLTIRNILQEYFLVNGEIKILKETDTTLLAHGKKLSKYLYKLGFTRLAEKWSLSKPSNKIDKLSIGTSAVRYQLQRLGPELDRDLGGKADLRVDGFIPDPWQSQLFDIVDRKESALIVAPTSSGKTYAMYYCMERVLKESNEGIVVYVAPTKALVNQVSATVYARFKNKLMPDGVAVNGTFTRDYRNNAMNCQILVTVPEILEMLLLSPKLQWWVRRLKYLVLDEVHNLTQGERGVSWENCFLLSPCPFLALSATIQNPHEFQCWLEKMQEIKVQKGVLYTGNHKVNLVIHKHRHADLKKYIYNDEKGFNHLHPYSYLDSQVMLTNNGVPGSINLSPDELLQLQQVITECHPCQQIDELDPDVFFDDVKTGFLTKPQLLVYEELLKKVFEDCFSNFNSNYLKIINKLKCLSKAHRLSPNRISKNIPKLIEDLHAADMLPAIVFSYDRLLVEECFVITTEHYEHLSEQREKKMKEKKSNKGKDREIVEDRLKKKDKNLMEEKDVRVARLKMKNEEISLELLIDTESPLRGRGLNEDDLKFIESRLVKWSDNKDHYFYRGLRHGVGMHHAGLNAKQRSSVEMLFRMKFLNCLYATGSLALGIHTPCKTVVLAGDSVFINSLEYHQMSGRAGRRGYDNVGHVVFYGLPEVKNRILLTSPLASMFGSFPVSVPSVLKMMLLVSKVSEPKYLQQKSFDYAFNRCMVSLEASLLYQTLPNLKGQIKFFFYFSVQFLMYLGVLDTDGNPQQLAGLITHLSYLSPGNTAFIYLFLNGYIRKLCRDPDEAPIKLMVLLNFLFGRIPIKKEIEEKRRANGELKNSIVILPELESFIMKGLNEYNDMVKNIFKIYFQTFADTLDTDCNHLPLSKVKIEPVITENKNIIQDLKMSPQVRHVCSSFTALSGNTDDDIFTEDGIISNIRHDIFTHVNSIPIIDINVCLNSYALDFYKHGVHQSIIDDNKLKSGESFAKLKDFNLLLKTISMSLEEYEPLKQNDVIFTTFKKISDEFNLNMVKSFNM